MAPSSIGTCRDGRFHRWDRQLQKRLGWRRCREESPPMFNTTRWNRLRYSLYAPVYDAVAERAFRRPRRLSLGQVPWQPGMRVPLGGAGTGLDLPWLPRDMEPHATALTPAMTRSTGRRAEARGIAEQAAVTD